MHPNSMVLTLTGAGLLWFGWFGFNGGSGLHERPACGRAFAATQVAAAAAGLSWMLVEWLHRGKPTALGLASGIVAGLVAVTPASGFVLPWGGLVDRPDRRRRLLWRRQFASRFFKYDDSLDAFGVHGVGGFPRRGADRRVLCQARRAGEPGAVDGLLTGGGAEQVIDPAGGRGRVRGARVRRQPGPGQGDRSWPSASSLPIDEEIEGLDRTEHGEVGFDFGLAMESVSTHATAEPRPADRAADRARALPGRGRRRHQRRPDARLVGAVPAQRRLPRPSSRRFIPTSRPCRAIASSSAAAIAKSMKRQLCKRCSQKALKRPLRGHAWKRDVSVAA